VLMILRISSSYSYPANAQKQNSRGSFTSAARDTALEP
jgi:hypothetical protein